MKQLKTTITATALALLLGGCAGTMENPPLVFGKSLTVGIGISSSAPEQGADLTLGVNSKNIAVVPVSLSGADGEKVMIDSQGEETDKDGNAARKARDALSVLGQFEVGARQQSPSVSLGEFFATGSAARRLAGGFACEMGQGQYCNSVNPASD